jgi:Phosphotransferase enzyme family
MNSAFQTHETSIPTSELQKAIGALLNPGARSPLEATILQRKPYTQRSSFALEELLIVDGQGRQFALIFKNASPASLSQDARRAKPRFLDDPCREIEVYRTILDRSGLGTPTYFGSVCDEQSGRYWLFLEKVKGAELYQIGDFRLWQSVAEWLAAFHDRFARIESLPGAAARHLIQHDAGFYWHWIERAQRFVAESAHPARSAGIEFLNRLARQYRSLIDETLALPQGLLHGEFYASNVMLDTREIQVRICPLDWEQAAIGPCFFDLAAFTSGKWTEQEQHDLGLSYYRIMSDHYRDALDQKAFQRAVILCRLLLAVQWLGWSRSWRPPAEQRQDWLAAAQTAARQLCLQ